VAWLTVTVDTDRDAVRLAADAPANTVKIELWRRSPSGNEAYVRGYGPGGGLFVRPMVVRDFEAPLNVQLAYYARALDASNVQIGAIDGPVTITVPAPNCSDTWLTDITRPTNSLKITMEELEKLEHDVPAGVHSILGRRDPIVSMDVARTPTFELLFLTATDGEKRLARGALGNAIPVLLRTPPANGIGNVYLAVTSFNEERITQLATVTERRWVVEGVQVARPDPTLFAPPPPVTYDDVKTKYATYAAMLAAGSYDDVLYDYTGPAVPVAPWPPNDV
jgi:hypothetical protein